MIGLDDDALAESAASQIRYDAVADSIAVHASAHLSNDPGHLVPG
jgi:hypothetical protein